MINRHARTKKLTAQRINGLVSLNNLSSWLWKVVRAMLVIGISFVILFPIFRQISISLRHKDDIYNPSVVWVPERFTLDNFRLIMEVMDYPKLLLNSFVLSSVTTLLLLLSCSLAGYAFAKLKFKGIGLLFPLVILTILVPPQTIMVPSYLNFKDFDLIGLLNPGVNLLDSYWPFILSSVTAMGLNAGLYIYIFRQFFRGIPKELEEAAYMDGAGVIQTYVRIIMPNAVPAIITVMLFSFVWQWNDSYFTGLYFSKFNVISTKLATLPNDVYVYLGELSGVGVSQVDPFYVSVILISGTLLAIFPLIVLYAFVRRYFVEGVERTGIIG